MNEQRKKESEQMPRKGNNILVEVNFKIVISLKHTLR